MVIFSVVGILASYYMAVVQSLVYLTNFVCCIFLLFNFFHPTFLPTSLPKMFVFRTTRTKYPSPNGNMFLKWDYGNLLNNSS